jgi:hypothetical protein
MLAEHNLEARLAEGIPLFATLWECFARIGLRHKCATQPRSERLLTLLCSSNHLLMRINESLLKTMPVPMDHCSTVHYSKCENRSDL